MNPDYATLASSALAAGARLAELKPHARASLDDPAIAIMTDLREFRAASIAPERTLDEAHAVMIGRGMRLLFVLDDDRVVVGVLTMTDLLGEKPVHFMQERGLRRGDVLVSDLMTPAERLEAVALGDVMQMRVGHIVATLKAAGREHLLVAGESGQRVCGLFSAQRIARQLGIDLETMAIARTFAEVEAALAR